MGTSQLEYTPDEILADHRYAEPLVVRGVRCHGGFDENGEYRSPRTLNRSSAVEAWEEQRRLDFGSEPLDLALESWPEAFPNVAQSKFLISHGVTAPTVSALTRIGTVEGFGGLLRFLPIPDWSRCFDQDVRGTAIAHIGTGLFEAHARDEAGHTDEAGHDKMWFLARDIAFENPVTGDETARMLERMGITDPSGRMPDLDELRRVAAATRVLPDDVDLSLEMVVRRMIGLLFIEIAAFHTFRWAEELLSDTSLVAGDGEPARLVAYIRTDEAPHVAYLRTALSEMRDRTWIGTTGTSYEGAEMMGMLWDRAVEETTVLRRADNITLALREVTHAVADRPDGDDLVEEMLSLGSVRRLPDGTAVDPGDPRYPG